MLSLVLTKALLAATLLARMERGWSCIMGVRDIDVIMPVSQLSHEFRRICDAQLRHLQTALRGVQGECFVNLHYSQIRSR